MKAILNDYSGVYLGMAIVMLLTLFVDFIMAELVLVCMAGLASMYDVVHKIEKGWHRPAISGIFTMQAMLGGILYAAIYLAYLGIMILLFGW